jgi:hypothetical protein
MTSYSINQQSTYPSGSTDDDDFQNTIDHSAINVKTLKKNKHQHESKHYSL